MSPAIDYLLYQSEFFHKSVSVIGEFKKLLVIDFQLFLIFDPLMYKSESGLFYVFSTVITRKL